MIIPCTLSVRFADCVNKTWQESFFEVCDDYFRYGREVAILHQNISRRRAYNIREENHPISLQELILKVLTVFTIIIPLIMAIGKAYFRSNYTFVFSEPLHPLLQTPRGNATHFSTALSYQNAFFPLGRKLSLPSRRSSFTDITHMDPNEKPLGDPLSEIPYPELKERFGNGLNLFKPMHFPVDPLNTPLKTIDLLIQKILSHPMRTIDGKNSFEDLENAWNSYIKNIPSCKNILYIQKQRALLSKEYNQFSSHVRLWMQRLGDTPAEVENPLIANSYLKKSLSDCKNFLAIFSDLESPLESKEKVKDLIKKYLEILIPINRKAKKYEEKRNTQRSVSAGSILDKKSSSNKASKINPEKEFNNIEKELEGLLLNLEDFSNRLKIFFKNFSELLLPLYKKRLTENQPTNAALAIKNLTLHVNLLDLIHLLEKTVWYPGNNRLNASNSETQKLFQTSVPYLTAGELRKIKQHFSEDHDQPVSVISYTPEEERKSRTIIPPVVWKIEEKKSLDPNNLVEKNGKYFSDTDRSFRDLQAAEPSYMILDGKLIHAGRKIGNLNRDLSNFPLKFPEIQNLCEEILQSVPKGEIHKKGAFFLEKNGDIHLCIEGYPMNTPLDSKLGPLFFDSFENKENPDTITPYACPCVVENKSISFHSPDVFYRLGKEIGPISDCKGFELSYIYNVVKKRYKDYLIEEFEEENDVVTKKHFPFFLKKRNGKYFVYEALDIKEIAHDYSEMAGRVQLSVYPSNKVIKDRAHKFSLNTDYKQNDLCLEVGLKEEIARDLAEKQEGQIKASEGPFFYHEELGLVKAQEHKNLPGRPYFVDLDTTYFPVDSLALEQKTTYFRNKEDLFLTALRNPHLKEAELEIDYQQVEDDLEKTMDKARKKMDRRIEEVDDLEKTMERVHKKPEKKIEEQVEEMTLIAKALEKAEAKLENIDAKSVVEEKSPEENGVEIPISFSCAPFFLTTSGKIIPADYRPALSLRSFFLREDAVYCTSEFPRDFAKAIVLQNDASNLKNFFLKDLQGFLKSRGLERIKIKDKG